MCVCASGSLSLFFPLVSGSLKFPSLCVSVIFLPLSTCLWNPSSSLCVSEFEFLHHVPLTFFVSHSLCLYTFLHVSICPCVCVCLSLCPSLYFALSLFLSLYLLPGLSALAPPASLCHSPQLSWAIPVPLPGLACSPGHKSLNQHFPSIPEIMSAPQWGAGVLAVALVRGFASLHPQPHRPWPAWSTSVLGVCSPRGAPGEEANLCLHTTCMSLGVCLRLFAGTFVCESVGTLQTHPFTPAWMHASIQRSTHPLIQLSIRSSIHPPIQLIHTYIHTLL